MLGNRAQRSLVLAGILHDLYEATGSNGGRFYFFTRAFTPARRIDNALMQVADGNISQAARLLRRGNRQENEDAAIQLIRSYLVFAAERTGTSTDANAARTFGQELNALLPDGIPEELNPNFIIAAGLYTRRMNNPDAPRYAIPEEVERRVAEPVHMPEREFGDQIESHITREEGLFRPEYMRPIRRAAPRPRPEPRERQEEMTPRQYARSIRELLRQIPEDSEIAAEARRTIRHLRSTNTRIIGNAMRQAPELITRLETEARENPRPPLEERRRPQGGEAQGAAGRRRSDRQADSQEPVSGRRNILVIGDSLTASIGRNPQSIRTFESAMEEQEGVSMGEEPVMHGFTGASAYEISNHLFSRRRRSSGREAQEDDDRQRRIRARREAILDARDDIRLNRSDYTDVFIEMGGNDLNARGTSPLISAVQIINSLEQAYETASRQWGLRVFGVTIPPGWGYNGSRDPSQSNNPSGAWGISNERVRDLVNEWIRGNVYLLYRSNRRGRPQEIVDVVGREEFDRSDYGDDIEVLSPPSLSGVVDLDPVLMQNPYETPYHEVEEWNQGTLRERYNLGRRADPDLVRDGLHPNEEGQEQIMRAFAGVLHPPIEETMPRREDLDLTDEHRQRNLERAEDPAISLKSGKRRRAIAR
jgi:lysophospholipase L1-like esterase